MWLLFHYNEKVCYCNCVFVECNWKRHWCAVAHEEGAQRYRMPYRLVWNIICTRAIMGFTQADLPCIYAEITHVILNAWHSKHGRIPVTKIIPSLSRHVNTLTLTSQEEEYRSTSSHCCWKLIKKLMKLIIYKHCITIHSSTLHSTSSEWGTFKTTKSNPRYR